MVPGGGRPRGRRTARLDGSAPGRRTARTHRRGGEAGGTGRHRVRRARGAPRVAGHRRRNGRYRPARCGVVRAREPVGAAAPGPVDRGSFPAGAPNLARTHPARPPRAAGPRGRLRRWGRRDGRDGRALGSGGERRGLPRSPPRFPHGAHRAARPHPDRGADAAPHPRARAAVAGVDRLRDERRGLARPSRADPHPRGRARGGACRGRVARRDRSRSARSPGAADRGPRRGAGRRRRPGAGSGGARADRGRSLDGPGVGPRRPPAPSPLASPRARADRSAAGRRSGPGPGGGCEGVGRGELPGPGRESVPGAGAGARDPGGDGGAHRGARPGVARRERNRRPRRPGDRDGARAPRGGGPG